ncbi:hypothetical protein LI088_04310 [Adlercreutzia equolifaciens]|uniref:hypothetical protein n=1 Tax=Adlercreutzia TaxID=447020 RepID=UPI001D0856B0|nr:MULTISPECIES: hypothetical protein [Adlercreutzia]MCB6760094.1 hypothetical protein [Adlercreutzia equolifaciens]MCB6975687.1 hypothetical protein [Adlercreutzia equolifaciens]MCQ5070833.1 hypothetical protein [Adlercreutzia sp. DFI.6.23]MDE8683831.1 hypothetical protein [Adlercreutzia rubneri]
MRNEKLYRQAIEIASYAEERFLEAREANQSFNDNPELKEKHRQMEVQPAAAEACAQQSLIAELFGVSEEKVHEDLARAILARETPEEVGA